MVGLEQTVESKPLPSFPFPEKVVLVLGRERSGIPPHFLQVSHASLPCNLERLHAGCK